MNDIQLTDEQVEWLEAFLEGALDGSAEDDEVIYSILEQL